jgi:hypothetical protein
VVFAITEFVGDTGGELKLREGVRLVIPAGALEGETKISAVMSSRQIEQGLGRKQLIFTFKPDGLIFATHEPAKLYINKHFFEEVENANDVVICEGVGGEEMPVVEENETEFIISIPHFSYYYWPRH